jgi:hypothetical protein
MYVLCVHVCVMHYMRYECMYVMHAMLYCIQRRLYAIYISFDLTSD